ncbi:MAG: type I methionyl aminopeptidase [Salinispira sp.]
MTEPVGDPIKTEYQIHMLAQAAEILFELFSEIEALIRPGCTGIEVQDHALQYFTQKNAVSALRNYRGFHADISISVNDTAAHGLPNARAFKQGDIVTVDSAISYRGYYGDMAWTFGIPPIGVNGRRLIAAAWRSCIAGCLKLQAGSSMTALGNTVINTAETLGGRVVNEFCGHGIGRNLHEFPLIPYISKPHTSENSEEWKFRRGMVLNVEPVVTFDDPSIIQSDDGMSYIIKNGNAAAQFELTCAITDNKPRFLSLPGMSITDNLEYPPRLHSEL